MNQGEEHQPVTFEEWLDIGYGATFCLQARRLVVVSVWADFMDNRQEDSTVDAEAPVVFIASTLIPANGEMAWELSEAAVATPPVWPHWGEARRRVINASRAFMVEHGVSVQWPEVTEEAMRAMADAVAPRSWLDLSYDDLVIAANRVPSLKTGEPRWNLS